MSLQGRDLFVTPWTLLTHHWSCFNAETQLSAFQDGSGNCEGDYLFRILTCEWDVAHFRSIFLVIILHSLSDEL